MVFSSQTHIRDVTKGGVLLLGVGGLGSAVALALMASDVSRLLLVDDDTVSLSNLHRQILFQTSDIGQNKAFQGRENLLKRHTNWQIEVLDRRLEEVSEIAELASEYQVVVDASDNFKTRFAANDASVYHGFPLVHGAAIGVRGQLCTLKAGGKPCLRCLFGGPPMGQNATCREEGVFGPLVGEVGWLMAMEAVKCIQKVGKPLFGTLLTIDAHLAKRRTVSFSANSACSVCADGINP